MEDLIAIELFLSRHSPCPRCLYTLFGTSSQESARRSLLGTHRGSISVSFVPQCWPNRGDHEGLETPFSHSSFSLETSSTLDKYSRKVLSLTAEDNQPQERYHSCESRSTMIQEDVITNDIRDYRSQQHQRERYEPVRKQHLRSAEQPTQ